LHGCRKKKWNEFLKLQGASVEERDEVVAQSGQDFATKIGNEHFIQDIGATAT
jgi:hypothetical protein